MVYAIVADGLGRIKIGKAANPEKRLRELQIGSPVKLSLTFKAGWHDSNEKLLHACFQEERLHGEWFRQSPRIEEFLSGVRSIAEEDGRFEWAMQFISKEIPPARNEDFLRRYGVPPGEGMSVQH